MSSGAMFCRSYITLLTGNGTDVHDFQSMLSDMERPCPTCCDAPTCTKYLSQLSSTCQGAPKTPSADFCTVYQDHCNGKNDTAISWDVKVPSTSSASSTQPATVTVTSNLSSTSSSSSSSFNASSSASSLSSSSTSVNASAATASTSSAPAASGGGGSASVVGPAVGGTLGGLVVIILLIIAVRRRWCAPLLGAGAGWRGKQEKKGEVSLPPKDFGELEGVPVAELAVKEVRAEMDGVPVVELEGTVPERTYWN